MLRGPYRFVRDPMCLGAGLALMGSALYYESATPRLCWRVLSHFPSVRSVVRGRRPATHVHRGIRRQLSPSSAVVAEIILTRRPIGASPGRHHPGESRSREPG
ncbi:MAG: hypothetical protein HKM89_12470 [Gemmatimonadales bacterium]|nr:hypothetical protein [Gemmatimonadales bacterium]